MLGMIFNIRVGIRVRSSCVLGIVFDTCIYGESALLSAWVSFSIPVLAWREFFLVLGIVFDTREESGC